jgi:hypothetical protein
VIPLAITAGIELWVLWRLRFGWRVVAMVLAGLLVDWMYLGYTTINERNYDTMSHVFYVDYLIEHLRLPPVNILCTACGHPPLYYAALALWSEVVLAGGFIPRELGLQWLSLLLSFGFVAYALLLLRSFVENSATFMLAATLVVFWPSSVLNSVRVHNDALSSVLGLAALYFISKWDRRGERRDFRWALIACALGILTKATGYAVAAVLLWVAALRLRLPEFRRETIRQGIVAVGVVLAAALLPVALRGRSAPLTLCLRVLGGACYVPEGAFVANGPLNYLEFDVRDFLRDTSSMRHPPAQDYFWNGLAKSSLFGVMPLGKDFEGLYYDRLAVLLGVLLLAMVVVCIAAWPLVRPLDWPRYRAIVLASVCLLSFLAAFRMAIPTPFHEDFRHVFPLLVPFCLVYAKSVERIGSRSALLGKVGVGLGALMIAASAAFFVRRPFGGQDSFSKYGLRTLHEGRELGHASGGAWVVQLPS